MKATLILFLTILCLFVCTEGFSKPGKDAFGFERTSFWFVHPGLTDADIAAQVESFSRSGANAVMIGAGRHHYLYDDLPFLEQQIEVTQRVVKTCHTKGIRVIEHHSVVATTRKDLIRERADWIQKSFETGQPSVWPEYQTFAFCPNNPEFREHYWNILSDFVRRTGVDAVMSDDTVFHHGCACDTCARRWEREVGGDLRKAYQESRKAGTPEWRLWNETRRRWFADFRLWLYRRMQKEMPEVGCFSLVGSVTSPWGAQTSGGTVEGQLDSARASWWEIYNPADFYSWRRQSAEAAALAEAARVRGTHPVALPYADRAEKRDVFDPEEEVFMWGLARAFGMSYSLSRVFLTGLTPQDAPRSFWLFERDHPELARKADPAGAIGVFFSRRSRDADPQWETFHSAPATAWAESLTDECVPWRALTEESFDKGQPRGLRTLILPNVFAVSDRHLGRIERFVRQGGTVIASFQPFTCDETGMPALEKRRSRIEKLFGIRLNSLQWANDPGTGRPRADFTPAGASRMEGSLEAYLHKPGRGTAIYLPSLAELNAFQDNQTEAKPYQDSRQPETVRDLAKLASGMTPSQPVRITRADPGYRLLTTVYRSGRTLYIHLLNTAGADLAPGSAVPDPSAPVWKPGIKLTLTFERPLSSVRLVPLDKEDDVTIERSGPAVTLTSPRRYGVLVVEQKGL